jgi:hypothetical protein
MRLETYVSPDCAAEDDGDDKKPQIYWDGISFEQIAVDKMI